MKLKNITRMQYKPPYGWAVRFHYNRKAYQKFFNDSKYGGENLALLAAISWLKDTRRKLGIPETSLPVVGASRSNTGVRGVSFSEKSNRYFASWTDARGKLSTVSFSVKRYGKKKAFKLACAKRKEGEELRLNGYIAPDKIKRQCGRMVKNPRKYSPEELIAVLLVRYHELGRVPTSRDFKYTHPKYNRYETAFGSWNNALQAAGLIEG
ncbi:MAG: hypothetical protein CSA32_01920 [Desulfobulbus propionicus]|nr:MAG: hypothetical protein CSA32_01920 [Desulfobulbus propionicus]